MNACNVLVRHFAFAHDSAKVCLPAILMQMDRRCDSFLASDPFPDACRPLGRAPADGYRERRAAQMNAGFR